LPLAYSQGYNPRPRINIGAALPLGYTSECEITDVWLEQNLDPGEILASLQAASPPGISFISARRIGGKEPSLQSQIRSAEYEVRSDVLAEQTDIQERVLKTLDADQLPSERRGKAYDLRPLIEELQLVEDREGHPILRMRLSAREGATGRPDEVCHQLDLDVFRSRIHRTRLIL
jgi:radical SAM-linked protein